MPAPVRERVHHGRRHAGEPAGRELDGLVAEAQRQRPLQDVEHVVQPLVDVGPGKPGAATPSPRKNVPAVSAPVALIVTALGPPISSPSPGISTTASTVAPFVSARHRSTV